MKKTLFIIFAAAAIFTGCNQEAKEERKISKRNYAITKDLSYNDLFMDSMSLVKYIDEQSIPDSIARKMTSFYNTRNYEYAWFGSEGIAEQGFGFSSLLNFSDDTSKSLKDLHERMNGLIGAGDIKITASNKKVLQMELELTENLLHYTRSNFKKGYVKRREIEQFIPAVKVEARQMADSLITSIDKQKKDFSEINEPFKLLSEQLKIYLDLDKNKTWSAIGKEIKKVKKGKQSPQVAAMKRNLSAIGDLPVKDSSELYDDNLVQGIKNFQKRHGFTPEGKITDQVVALMNITPDKRIKQLLINMNRMRWIPYEPKGKLLLVNTPEFILRVLDEGKKVFDMPVVVGKEGHNTTLFSDMLTTIVFSPYWNVPPGITREEILPSIEKNPDYLEMNNMEIYGELNGTPTIRQKPGPKNSLGKVKFLFPNSFNIYFHDTPAKALFNKDVRAYSHGCIRLAEPEKLAAYLLKENKGWKAEKINTAMNKGEEEFVKLKDPVPVFLTYYTAWVDEAGVLQFRNDIYGHDEEIGKKMFIN